MVGFSKVYFVWFVKVFFEKIDIWVVLFIRLDVGVGERFKVEKKKVV